ncbi:MAG: CoA transferase subunit A [Desulfuromonadales bacterium]|nr:CoA transferase subunit A [Desulfuromonadales bacterium]NIR33132.1 CoA transferase subunit A [Desulfuromonadales bacterium]NIS41429.1 CoA transferase subunit A [Desulfuromonadales bacterium]
MQNKVVEIEDVISRLLEAGQTWMIGGFGRGGVPFTLLERIARAPKDFSGLTLVKNDANEPGLGIDLLLRQGMVKKLIATHIGLNPDFIDQMNRDEVACELVPQGIFAERIRAGGVGIPAFLSDIGLGTEVAEGRQTLTLDGKELLVEYALQGDVALACADVVDRSGNAWWRGSNRNMCVPMVSACRTTILEAKEIVDVGSIAPENVQVPGVLVDAVVQAQPRAHIERDRR